MYFDSINLAEGSSIEKLVVAKGTSFPASANMGELFFRTDENKLYAYSGTEWIASGSGGGLGGLSSSVPKITNVEYTDSSFTVLDDTAAESNATSYIKITGTGFVSGCNAAVGSLNATSVQFVNSTTLNVTIPGQTQGNYFFYVVNPDGGTAIRVNGVSFSDLPAWQTSATLPTYTKTEPVSLQLSATNAVSYSLQAGSTLPSGLSLNSSGLLSGTAPNVNANTVYTFTVIATDAQNQESARTFSLQVNNSNLAYGGTVTTSGNYKIHTYTTSGTFNVVNAGGTVEYLIVGGGGGGSWRHAGGGGAGGFVSGTFNPTTGSTYTITVGAGGAGRNNDELSQGIGPGFNGSNSSISSIGTAFGGGGGGTFEQNTPSGTFGSGGGGASLRAGAGGTSGQGNSGGAGATTTAGGGGGGGAGGAGGDAPNGNGGIGRRWPADTGPYYAGGGGGAWNTSTGPATSGGLGGGGAGAWTDTTTGYPGNGTQNTGGGGGSTRDGSSIGGSGGSGIVIIRYTI